MNGIDRLSSLINMIVCFVLGLGALGGGIYYILSKKGFFKKFGKKEENYKDVPNEDSSKFITFDDIKDNMIIADNFTRFIAGVKTNGVDYYNGTDNERARVMLSYIEYVNSITSPTKIYIQATEDDVSDFIDFFDELIAKHSKDISNFKKDVGQLNYSLSKLDSNDLEGRNIITEAIYKKQIQIEKTEWMIERIENKKLFVIQTSSKEVRDKAESYIFVEYNKPLSFAQFTDEEVVQKAKRELDIQIKNIIRGHKKAGVDCTVLNSIDLGRINRSAFNPLDGDRVGFEELLNSNMYSLYAKGETVQELQMKAFLEDAENNVEDKRGIEELVS